MHPLATKNFVNSPLLGILKLDQIAFIARSDEDERLIKSSLGLSLADWTEDECVAKGSVRGHPGEQTNRAKLLFNYDMGIEVEILRYIEGANYADVNQIPSCQMCHIGFHVEKGAKVPSTSPFKFPIQQCVVTQTHTNQFLIDSGRRYRYTIYDSTAVFGTHLKVIERLGDV